VYGLLFRGVATLAVALAVIVTPTYAMSPAPPLPTLPVQIHDECNPATFNAAVGPGTCVGSGAVTFQQFVAKLQRFQFAPQWQFVPGQLHMRVNQSLTATNMGGRCIRSPRSRPSVRALYHLSTTCRAIAAKLLVPSVRLRSQRFKTKSPIRPSSCQGSRLLIPRR